MGEEEVPPCSEAQEPTESRPRTNTAGRGSWTVTESLRATM